MNAKDLAKKDYEKGATYKAISEKYDITVNTLKSWRNRHGWKRNADAKSNAGAPKGSANAKGNKGGAAPKGNKNAEKSVTGYVGVLKIERNSAEIDDDVAERSFRKGLYNTGNKIVFNHFNTFLYLFLLKSSDMLFLPKMPSAVRDTDF